MTSEWDVGQVISALWLVAALWYAIEIYLDLAEHKDERALREFLVAGICVAAAVLSMMATFSEAHHIVNTIPAIALRTAIVIALFALAAEVRMRGSK